MDDFVGPVGIERRFVRNQDDVALPADQFILKHTLGVHIEMIGRLVQYQKIRLRKHQHADLYFGLFTAAQGGDGLHHAFGLNAAL